jgi:Fic family protein
VDQLLGHYEKKLKEAEHFKRVAAVLNDLNERQIALLTYLEKHPDSIIEIKAHQTKNGIAYETARKDLLTLAEKSLLTEVQRGNKKIYIANDNEVKKLFLRIK